MSVIFTMSPGSMSAEAPRSFPYLRSCSASASPAVVTSTRRSPRLLSGTVTTACRASGHRASTSISTAPSDTISAPILAKRLALPRMVMKPSRSTETMSPVSCQPSSACSSPGRSTLIVPIIKFGPDSSSRPPSVTPCTGSSRTRTPGRGAPHRSFLVVDRGVYGDYGRGLGQPKALEDLHAEALTPGAPGLRLDGLGTGHDDAQRREIVTLGCVGVIGQESVRTNHDCGLRPARCLRDQLVVQGRGIKK